MTADPVAPLSSGGTLSGFGCLTERRLLLNLQVHVPFTANLFGVLD